MARCLPWNGEAEWELPGVVPAACANDTASVLLSARSWTSQPLCTHDAESTATMLSDVSLESPRPGALIQSAGPEMPTYQPGRFDPGTDALYPGQARAA